MFKQCRAWKKSAGIFTESSDLQHQLAVEALVDAWFFLVEAEYDLDVPVTLKAIQIDEMNACLFLYHASPLMD